MRSLRQNPSGVSLTHFVLKRQKVKGVTEEIVYKDKYLHSASRQTRVSMQALLLIQTFDLKEVGESPVSIPWPIDRE